MQASDKTGIDVNEVKMRKIASNVHSRELKMLYSSTFWHEAITNLTDVQRLNMNSNGGGHDHYSKLFEDTQMYDNTSTRTDKGQKRAAESEWGSWTTW